MNKSEFNIDGISNSLMENRKRERRVPVTERVLDDDYLYNPYYEAERLHKEDVNSILLKYYKECDELEAREVAARLSVLEFKIDSILSDLSSNHKLRDIYNYIGIPYQSIEESSDTCDPYTILNEMTKIVVMFRSIYELVLHDTFSMKDLAREYPEAYYHLYNARNHKLHDFLKAGDYAKNILPEIINKYPGLHGTNGDLHKELNTEIQAQRIREINGETNY